MRRICLIISILVLVSCAKTKEIQKETIPSDHSDTISLKTNDIPDFLDISSRIKDIKIIPLQEKDGINIGGVDKVLLHNKDYVVLDKQTAKKVLVFNAEGDFKKELVEIGRGPGEVLQINGMWKNEDGGVTIYDYAAKKVVKFDHNYKYKEAQHTDKDLIFDHIAPVPGTENFVGYAGYNISNPKYNDKNYQLTWLSKKLKPEAYALAYDDELRNILVYKSPSSFTRVKDSLRFFRYYDSNIYNLSEDREITKRYVIGYGHKQLPKDYETSIFLSNVDLLKESDQRDFDRISNLFKDYFYFTGQWFETPKYSLFETGRQEGQDFITLYDKTTKETVGQCIAFSISKPYYMYLPPPTTVQGDRFVAVLPGEQLKLYVDDPQSPFYDVIREHENYEFKNFIIEYRLK